MATKQSGGVDTRTVFIRIVEFSPLIALALLTFILVTVPIQLIYQLAMISIMPMPAFPAEYAKPTAGTMATQYFAMLPPTESGGASPDGGQVHAPDGDLFLAADAFAQAYTAASVSGTPTPSMESTMAKGLAAYQARYGGTVSVYTVPETMRPSLVTSAIAAPELLPSVAELAERIGRDASTDTFERVRQVSNGRIPVSALDFASYTANSSNDGTRSVDSFGATFGSRTYAYYVVRGLTEDPADQESMLLSERQPFATDPQSPGFREALDAYARTEHVDVFVAGPLPTRLEPLVSTDMRRASAMAPAAFPGLHRGIQQNLNRIPDGLAPTFAPDEWAMAFGSNTLPHPYGDGSGSPSPLLFVATFPAHPGLAGTGSAAAWRDFRIGVASQLVWLLPLAFGLLGASLVASPVAFVYERRRMTRDKLAAEMGRVQRDAHDKVYNRLSALSKRVEIASGAISADVARDLEGVAGDIRDTVGDLQQILGDERLGDGALVSGEVVAQQLCDVCAAGAVRHDVQVDCSVMGSLPDMPGILGWDLQCVAEEGITNAAQHGRASMVSVRIESVEDAIRLTVADDGVGPASGLVIDELPGSSTGLRGMRQRILEHGGAFDVMTGEGGTTLVAVFRIKPR